jgi:hypothetical protein
MPFTQVVEEIKHFSGAEIEALIELLQEQKLRNLEKEFAQRLGTGQVFFNEPIILPENTPSLREYLEAKDS